VTHADPSASLVELAVARDLFGPDVWLCWRRFDGIEIRQQCPAALAVWMLETDELRGVHYAAGWIEWGEVDGRAWDMGGVVTHDGGEN
jgi:hypothetical protein